MVKKTDPTFDGSSKGPDSSKGKKAGSSNSVSANRDKPAKAVKPAIAEYFAAATEKATRKKAADNFSAEFKAKHSSKKKSELKERDPRAEKFGDKKAAKLNYAVDPDANDMAEAADEKLQKVLARAGVGSRREMERAIEAGLVKVNDRIAKLGDRVTPNDKLFVDGKRVVQRTEATRRRVILYNKPEGEICSRSDPEGRRTVYDGLPALSGERWISIGRLDFNTSGLLLFTNDGELANKLMHPSSVIDREYLVRIQGNVDDEMKRALLEGVLLDDGVARFTDIVDGAGESRNRWFYCVVMEGRNREVRRLWESQGVKVSRLKRVRYANIFIPSHVRVGQWTELSEKEIADLCLTAGFDKDTHTKLMPPSRDEKSQRARHENKLRAASAPPRRSKPAPRKPKPE
jgi:23S rRNA pseudouridine2605 synthase